VVCNKLKQTKQFQREHSGGSILGGIVAMDGGGGNDDTGQISDMTWIFQDI